MKMERTDQVERKEQTTAAAAAAAKLITIINAVSIESMFWRGSEKQNKHPNTITRANNYIGIVNRIWKRIYENYSTHTYTRHRERSMAKLAAETTTTAIEHDCAASTVCVCACVCESFGR